MARADKKFKAIRGILSLLSTDSTIRSYVEDKIYALIAPQDVEGDFLIIRRDGYRRQDSKMGVSLQASVFYVFVISDDYDRSLDIADKVYDAITQNKGLPISTYTLSPLNVGFSVQSTSTFTVKEEA
jgi:hypothetical protein